MTQHAILDPATHRDLRVRTDPSSELGDAVMACLAVPSEFRRLSCDYPIVYRNDPDSGSFTALVLFGFEAGENLYLTDGRWDASVKPLAHAIQPFLIGRSKDSDAPAQVHIDLAHPRVLSGADGVRLFDDKGAPSPYLEQMIEMLGALDEGYREGRAFFEALERYDLLEPFSMDVTLTGGEVNRLVGYHLVNEEKMQLLEPGALAELHAAGHLLPIYMAMASLGHLGKLVDRKNKQAHG